MDKMKKTTLYNKSSKGQTKIWSIWTEGNVVVKEWCLEGCKIQQTRDSVKGKNIGKANETSDEEQAQFEMERSIRLKTEEGYATSLQNVSTSDIDWAKAILPDCFAPSKPETSIEPEDEAALVNKGAAVYQRKHNGMRAFVIKGTDEVNIYSRRLELKTENFPRHIEFFKTILPNNTIVDCEVIANDDPDLIKTIFGTHKDKAIERQKNQDVEFILFDILYYNGDDTSVLPYGPIDSLKTRYKLLKCLETVIQLEKIKLIRVVENIDKPKKIPKEWEGLVLKDRWSSTRIRWDGKPDRKSGSWKIKNFKEIDMVCYNWLTGKGKLNDNVATLQLGLYSHLGSVIPICESGSGLTDEMREEIKGLKMPFAIEIKYEEITPKGSLRLPIILRIRKDKKVSECTIADSPFKVTIHAGITNGL